MSLFPKFKIPTDTPAILATPATIPNESSGNSESSNPIEEPEKEAAILSQGGPPPCWNCGAITTETKDIYGEAVWVCWSWSDPHQLDSQVVKVRTLWVG